MHLRGHVGRGRRRVGNEEGSLQMLNCHWKLEMGLPLSPRVCFCPDFLVLEATLYKNLFTWNCSKLYIHHASRFLATFEPGNFPRLSRWFKCLLSAECFQTHLNLLEEFFKHRCSGELSTPAATSARPLPISWEERHEGGRHPWHDLGGGCHRHP